MRTLILLPSLLVALLVSQPALAGATAAKEQVGCTGGHKTFLYTYTFSPGGYSIYTARSKRSGTLEPWWTEFTSTEDAVCQYVGRGVPHGSFTHNWETRGGNEATNFVNFYNQDSCGPVP